MPFLGWSPGRAERGKTNNCHANHEVLTFTSRQEAQTRLTC